MLYVINILVLINYTLYSSVEVGVSPVQLGVVKVIVKVHELFKQPVLHQLPSGPQHALVTQSAVCGGRRRDGLNWTKMQRFAFFLHQYLQLEGIGGTIGSYISSSSLIAF